MFFVLARMIFVAKKGGNIVIIGGGASGMTAAIRAKQRGAEQVILLEASSELGGNAVYAPVPLLNPEQLTEDAIEKEYLEMMQFTDWTSDPRIVRTLLENSARIPAWLEESGADLKEGEKDGKLAAFLIAKCYELGVDVRLNCYAKKILKDANDWCSGVWVEQDGKHEEIEATVVVLATGGFLEENRLMEQFCPYYDDEIILELTDEMLSEYAPAYYSLLMAQTPENIRATQTEGAYYAMYGITKGAGASASRGMVIRTDWLSELNMDMPSTVEELTEILKAFKRTYNPQYPYFIEADADLVYMCAAFNTDTVGYYNDGALPVYRDGDEVKVAWATNEYRKFLEWFNECYQEGIFEPSFYSTASDQAGDRYSNLINGQIGVYEDSPTSIADWKQYALNGETVEVSFFPNLVDENGNNTWGEEQQVIDSRSAMSITTTCQNPELALEVLNYFFTEDGAIMANYGIEGYSFNYGKNGEVEYTELLKNSEYQLSMRALHGLYSWNLFPYDDSTEMHQHTLY